MACSSCGGARRTSVATTNMTIGSTYPTQTNRHQVDPYGTWVVTYPDGTSREFAVRADAFTEASRTGAGAQFVPRST